MWEAHLRGWNGFTYNRHTAYGGRPDFSRTWKRPWNGYKDPGGIGGLSFQSIMTDCTFAAATRGKSNECLACLYAFGAPRARRTVFSISAATRTAAPAATQRPSCPTDSDAVRNSF